MRSISLATLLMLNVSAPAFALDQCQSSKDDPSIRLCAYKPTQSYLVTGIVGDPVNITFNGKEAIKRYEWAYTGTNDKGEPTATWRASKICSGATQTASGPDCMPASAFLNNWPIWPSREGQSRVIVVTSAPGGDERPYQFVLVARKREADCAANPQGAGCPQDDATTKGITFTYPAEVQQSAVVAWKAKKAEQDQKAALDRLKVDPFYGEQNWAYEAHGKRPFASLAPSQISDNGIITAMQWPGNVQPPSVYLLNCKTGEEQIAPTIPRSDGLTVIDATSECFRLRLGKDQVLDLHNLAWSPHRPGPNTGTTSPDVVRTVIGRGE